MAVDTFKKNKKQFITVAHACNVSPWGGWCRIAMTSKVVWLYSRPSFTIMWDLGSKANQQTTQQTPGAWAITQLVECLLSTHKVLSLILRNPQNPTWRPSPIIKTFASRMIGSSRSSSLHSKYKANLGHTNFYFQTTTPKTHIKNVRFWGGSGRSGKKENHNKVCYIKKNIFNKWKKNKSGVVLHFCNPRAPGKDRQAYD